MIDEGLLLQLILCFALVLLLDQVCHNILRAFKLFCWILFKGKILRRIHQVSRQSPMYQFHAQLYYHNFSLHFITDMTFPSKIFHCETCDRELEK